MPASTFKIPHALIALQTGVVTDPDAMVLWDGIRMWSPAWERPHSLATAIRDSVVWFFQRTAVAIGRDRLHESLKSMRYGNTEVAGELTTFWLDDADVPWGSVAARRRPRRACARAARGVPAPAPSTTGGLTAGSPTSSLRIDDRELEAARVRVGRRTGIPGADDTEGRVALG